MTVVSTRTCCNICLFVCFLFIVLVEKRRCGSPSKKDKDAEKENFSMSPS